MTRDGARRPGRLTPLSVPALPVLVTVALLSGCSDPDTSEIPNDLPPPATSSTADRSLPPATGKWTGLKAKCPTLESAAARTLGVNGPGQPTPEYATNGPNVTADCRWGATDGRGMAVTSRLSLYESQEAADAAWRVLSAGQTQPLSGVGDEAFSSLEPPSVAVRVRSNNVVATVRIVVPDASDTARLRQAQPAAGEIARDVLDDLR